MVDEKLENNLIIAYSLLGKFEPLCPFSVWLESIMLVISQRQQLCTLSCTLVFYQFRLQSKTVKVRINGEVHILSSTYIFFTG